MKYRLALALLVGIFGFFTACASSRPQVLDLDVLFKEAWDTAWKDQNASRVLFERALVLARQQNNREKMALFLVNLGGLSSDVGDYPQALVYYGQSLEIQKTLPNPEEMLGRIFHRMGLTYEDIGDFAKAAQYFGEAVSLAQKINEKWDEATFLGNLGHTYSKLGDPSKALEFHQKALGVARELKDKERQGVAWDHIGQVQTEQGEFKAARTSFNTALAFSKETGGYPAPSLIEEHLSDLYLAEGDPAAFIALAKNRDAIRLGHFYLMTHQLALAQLRFAEAIKRGIESRHANLLVSSYIGLGLTLEQIGQTQAAKEIFDQAIAEIERQRDLLPLTARQTFLSGKSDSVFPRLEAYQGRARVSDSAAESFYWTENTKARTFVESLSKKFRKTATELPAELAQREAEITERVLSASKQLNLAFERNQMSRHKELGPVLAAAKQDQAALIKQLRQEYPKYSSLLYPEPARAEQIALRNKEVLLEYEVTENSTLLFVLRPGKPVERISIPVSRIVLGDLVRKFRAPFENPVDEDGRFKDEFEAGAAVQLFSLLLKPVLDKGLASAESEMIIVPSDVLGLLPFEALRASEKTLFVGEEFDIVYAQSASSLTQARTLEIRKNNTQNVLVLADPVFDRSDARLQKADRQAQAAPDKTQFETLATRAIAKRMSGNEEAGFVRLAETGGLARETNKLFGGSATTLVGLNANKETVLTMDLQKYRMVVFATHGILDDDIPYIREPALVLSLVDRKGKALDGFLKMSEVMDLKLNADLVALTACKTGLGHSVGGEGVVGLSRAFQYAGAKNVLVSLWSVAEKSTTLMTEAVLERLKQGDSPRQALKKARLKVRSLGFDHPFFWAPFVIVGT